MVGGRKEKVFLLGQVMASGQVLGALGQQSSEKKRTDGINKYENNSKARWVLSSQYGSVCEKLHIYWHLRTHTESGLRRNRQISSPCGKPDNG